MSDTVVIREATPADAEGLARVHVGTWQTAYSGILPDEFLGGLTLEIPARAKYWAGNLANPESGKRTFVALVGGRVVGFATGGASRERGVAYECELFAIYVLKEFQDSGAGKRLTVALVDALLEEGFRSMIVWALADNQKARLFYERLGGRPLQAKEIDLAGGRYLEAGYEWKDLKALAETIRAFNGAQA